MVHADFSLIDNVEFLPSLIKGMLCIGMGWQVLISCFGGSKYCALPPVTREFVYPGSYVFRTPPVRQTII